MSAAQPKAVHRQPASIALRDYAPEHREGVLRLSGQVFGPGTEAGLDLRLRWTEAAARDGLAPKRWVLVAGAEVIGFLMAVPLRYRFGADVQVAYTPSEYMVHPRHRFHGIRLMRAFFEACPDCVSCDDVEATVKVTEWLGAKRVGRLVRYAKVLDARLLRQRAGWAHAALPGLGLATRALSTVDRIRAWRRRSVDVTPVAGFDERFDALCTAMDDGRTASVLRDARFLRWRYGRGSPHSERRIGVVEDGGALAGYVVFHASIREGRVGRILDLQVRDPADHATFEALLAHAVRELRALGAWTARYYDLESPEGRVPEILRDHGFSPRHHYFLLMRLTDPRQAEVAADAARWRLTFGDVEASYAAR